MLPHVLTRKCGIRPWITCQRGIYGWPCGVDGSKNWHQWSDCVPLDLLSESRMLMLQPSQRVFRFDWTFKIRSHVCMLPGNGWCMLVLLYRCSWVIALDGHFYSHGDVAHVCVCVKVYNHWQLSFGVETCLGWMPSQSSMVHGAGFPQSDPTCHAQE